MARKGGGEAVLSLITAALLYALLWCVALASSQPVDFQSHGLWITGAVFGGGFLACVLCRGKKQEKAGQTASACGGKAAQAGGNIICRIVKITKSFT